MADTPSDDRNGVLGQQRPGLDDAMPEHEPGPDTPPDQLIKIIESNELAGARGTYATFLRDMSTIAALHWLSKRYRGSAYTEAADKAGIKRTRAKAVIQCELYEHRHDIFAIVHARAAQHKQKTGRDTYRYPQIGTLISWYQPDPGATTFQLGPMTNRSDDDVRQDAQQMSDALAEAKQAMEQLRQERRAERIAHDEAIAALERRAIAAELKLTEILAAYDPRGRDPIVVEVIGEPLLPLAGGTSPHIDPLDVVLDSKLDKTIVKTVQDDLRLPPFRGPVVRAHAVRAQYYMAVTAANRSGGTVTVPPTLREKDRNWWDAQAGKTARQIGKNEDVSADFAPRDPPTVPSDPLETMAQIAEQIDRANLDHAADDVGEDGNWRET
jgi:hypothetical protein